MQSKSTAAACDWFGKGWSGCELAEARAVLRICAIASSTSCKSGAATLKGDESLNLEMADRELAEHPSLHSCNRGSEDRAVLLGEGETLITGMNGFNSWYSVRRR